MIMVVKFNAQAFGTAAAMLSRAFCSNVAALPIDAASLFIRAVRDRTPGAAFGLTSELGQAAADTGRCDGGAEVLNERTAR